MMDESKSSSSSSSSAAAAAEDPFSAFASISASNPLPPTIHNIGRPFKIGKSDYKNWWLIPPLQLSKPFWLNLYGAPTDKTDMPSSSSTSIAASTDSAEELSSMMNYGRTEGTRYRGRLLLSLQLFETESSSNARQRSGAALEYSGSKGMIYDRSIRSSWLASGVVISYH
jgi:hypothetical protein